MYVYVHIWENNANVYADAEAARTGLADTIEDAQARNAVFDAKMMPGEPVHLDGGMSTLRYLSVTGSEQEPARAEQGQSIDLDSDGSLARAIERVATELGGIGAAIADISNELGHGLTIHIEEKT